MVENNNFKTYLSQLNDQSEQMKNKHVLRINQPFSKDIIAIADASSQFIDDLFFQNKMGEKKEKEQMALHDVVSYPVKIVCLRVGWIIYDEKINSMSRDGHKFLQSIVKSKDLDFFELKPLQILIEFLYKQIRIYL